MAAFVIGIIFTTPLVSFLSIGNFMERTLDVFDVASQSVLKLFFLFYLFFLSI